MEQSLDCLHLREGYHLEFETSPPLSRLAPVVRSSLDPRKMVILQEQFDALLQKKALEPVPPGAGPGFFSRIFVVPKKLEGVDPFIDLKALNQFIKPNRFKMESTESIRAALLPEMWTYSIDLMDAYFYIPIRPKSRRFL